MKNLLLGLLLLVCLPGYSQIKVGIKTGANLATMAYDNYFGSTHHHRIAFHLGAIAELNVSEKAFIRSELFHSRKGSKILVRNSSNPLLLDNPYSGIDESDYLIVPLLVGYRLSPRLSPYFGPEAGYVLGHYRDKENNYRDFDFGINAGVLYNITRSLALDLRYTYGLVKLRNVESDRGKEPIYDGQNRVAQIGVNYRFIRK